MPTSVITQEFDGLDLGMNLAKPAWEIDDRQARYLQDVLLHKPGLIWRRGPVRAISTAPTYATKASGIVQTQNPTGSNRIGVLHGDGSNAYLGALNGAYTTNTDITLTGAFPAAPPSTPYYIVDSKPAIQGGCWIGTSSSYDANAPSQNLIRWYGADKANYTTGTLSVTRGTTAVTGAGTTWSTNVVAGMFMFANTDDPFTSAYIGIVQSVNSSTSITLAAGSPYTCTAKAYTLQSVRGFAPRVVTGEITCTTTSTTVTGSNTKFKSQGVDTGTWTIHRMSDMAFVGKVSAVNNNTSITLAANAAVALNVEQYIALRADADYTLSTTAVANRKVGFINSTYSERNWYANLGQNQTLTYRLFFSDTSDPEAVDMSTFDGDFIDVLSTTGASSAIKAICASYNALVVLKDNEAFGVSGTTPTTFQVKKLEDDGVMDAMTVQPYSGGVIWAGRKSINFYNGVQTQSLTEDNLGDFYRNLMTTVDTSKYHMWSMLARNHYFLFIENCQSSQPVVKGATASNVTRLTIVVNMRTGAVTTATNLSVRGAVTLPLGSNEETWYTINDGTTGYLCRASDLFDTDGVIDSINSDGITGAQDLYIESKKYNGGHPMRLKLFKQLSAHYLVQGDALMLDTVMGLNNVGATASSVFPATAPTWDFVALTYGTWDNLGAAAGTWDNLANSAFKPKKIKFLKRSQNFSFRLYQGSSSVTRAQIGPFEIDFKLMRPGRV